MNILVFYVLHLILKIIFLQKNLKKRGPTEIRTRINGFKVQCANRYTIGPTTIYDILF